jgi:hypothetical protein
LAIRLESKLKDRHREPAGVLAHKVAEQTQRVAAGDLRDVSV